MTGRSQSDAGSARQPRMGAAAAHAAGLSAHRDGDLAQAITLVNEAAAADPSARYLADLTELCRQAGRLQEALAAGRRAVSLDPGAAAAFNNLGVVCFELGAPEEAAATTVGQWRWRRTTPRRTAISAMRWPPPTASSRPSPPIAGRSRSRPASPTAGPISAP